MRIILNGSVSTVKRLRIALGTFIALEAVSGSDAAAEAAIEAAFAAISAVDRRMHPQSAQSDLARINRSPVHTPVDVHASVGELLSLARQLHSATEGVFDPCLPSHPGRLHDIEFSADRVICHAPVALDFGGFAKGYAVDCAIDALISHGCVSGLVNAGGDLRVFGPRMEPIFVRGAAGELANIELTDAAIAVSDADLSQRPAEHQGYYVRRGAAANAPSNAEVAPRPAAAGVHDLTAASPLVTQYAAIIAQQAVVADALAKCVLLCPKPTADRALRAFSARRALPDQ